MQKLERTLSIIKPDAVAANNIGDICSYLERAGLKIIAMKMHQLTRYEAECFYAIHRDRVFFAELIDFITAGPVVLQVLEGINAVQHNRKIMGATNPQDAALGTIRADFATSISHNAVHGSDSIVTAQQEIRLFFAENELY